MSVEKLEYGDRYLHDLHRDGGIRVSVRVPKQCLHMLDVIKNEDGVTVSGKRAEFKILTNRSMQVRDVEYDSISGGTNLFVKQAKILPSNFSVMSCAERMKQDDLDFALGIPSLVNFVRSTAVFSPTFGTAATAIGPNPAPSESNIEIAEVRISSTDPRISRYSGYEPTGLIVIFSGIPQETARKHHLLAGKNEHAFRLIPRGIPESMEGNVTHGKSAAYGAPAGRSEMRETLDSSAKKLMSDEDIYDVINKFKAGEMTIDQAMSIFANAEIASERVAKRLSIEFDKSTKPHPLPVKVQSAPQPSSPPVAQKKQSTSNPKPQPEPRRNVAKLMGMMSPEHNSNGNVAELCEKLKAIEIGIERSRDLSERANLLKEEGSILLNLAFELAGTENASAVQSECCTMSKNSLSESGGIYKKLGDSRNLETVNSLTETANAFSEDIE